MSAQRSGPNSAFSVVIPTHDRPGLLAEAIASVVAQDGGAPEIIVVDDASDPPVADGPDHRVIRHDVARGPAAARNAGVAAATGELIAFLDDDDLWLPRRLALARSGLERAPIAVCFSRYVDEPASVAGRGRVLDGDVSATIREGMTPNFGQTALRRAAWVDLDESLGASEDVDWWIRITRDHAVATVPEVGFLYRRHEGARADTTGPRARIEAGLRLLDVHADHFAANPTAAAFHWFRIGLTCIRAGDGAGARRALWRSFRLRPSVRPLKHLPRTFRVRAR